MCIANAKSNCDTECYPDGDTNCNTERYPDCDTDAYTASSHAQAAANSASSADAVM